MTSKDTNRTRAQFGLQLVALAGLTAGMAQAAPQDGTVASGTATIDTVGDHTTITTGHTTIIDWASFDIANGESVEFVMPGASSRALNRIHSVTPTQIDGSLTANGQVYLVNSSGIVFGANSVVNVGALYAAAGNISNEDFINQTDRFTGLTGTVENRGDITGDLVAMIGAQVANIGSISAPSGTVIMAAGNQVLIGNLLGHRYVEIEVPVQPQSAADLSVGNDLTAGDTVSIAAWHSGTIEAGTAIVSAKGGDTMIEGTIQGGSGASGRITISGDNVIIDHSNSNNLNRAGAPITGYTVSISSGGGEIALGSDVHATGGNLSLLGDVRLTDDVSLTASGNNKSVRIHGDVVSDTGSFFDLSVNNTLGLVEFTGSIGDNPTSDQRLGRLDVNAELALVEHDVSTLGGMDFYSEVAVTGDSVTFHTGDGTSLFAGDVYSYFRGASDVAFLYDGDVSTGQGEQRVPFSFGASIGAPPALRAHPSSGAFRNIQFGDDTGSALTSASFFFSNAAVGGDGLVDAGAVDLSTNFYVSATESLIMGRGQVITAFGSLQLGAKGNGTTDVRVGDVNALGDLTVLSRGRMGGTITLQRHLGTLIDGVANEADRASGGYDEQTAELIAMGDLRLDGTLTADSAGALLGAEQVILANNSGTGTSLGLPIVTITSPISLANFTGTLPGTNGQAYAYDLTLGAFTPINTAETSLAELLPDEDTLTIRDDDPYLADRQVLFELGLNPNDPTLVTEQNGTQTGRERYLNAPSDAPVLTIDRLSPRSVDRLVEAYTALFGNLDAENGQRSELDNVRTMIASGELSDEMSASIRSVISAIDLLELTELERNRAKAALLEMLSGGSDQLSMFASTK